MYGITKILTLPHLMICICDLLCQNLPLTHTMAKNSFNRQWIAPSINKLITSTPLPNIDGFAFVGVFLRPVRCLRELGCPLNATG